MRVRFAQEALYAIRRKQAWWEENRDKAPELFRDELANVIARLHEGQLEGVQLYTVYGGHKIWRLLMPKTKAHIYYRIAASTHEIEVITVWNAVGGTGPDLSA